METSNPARDKPLPPDAQEAWRTRCFLIALFAYLLAYFLMRVLLPASLEIDEAEMVYLAQRPHLGHGAQPPLYAWLQWLVFAAFGVDRFALAALKTALITATYLCFFGLARRLLTRDAAIAASASLALIPEIGWSWLVDRTHSILLTALCCASLWAYFALLRKPERLRYAGFGLLLGLGLQAKYNFALFLAGLVLASIAVAEHRRVLWTRRAGIAIGVAFLAVLPHGFWLASHLDEASAGSAVKLAGDGNGTYLVSVAVGLSQLLLAALAFAAPLLLAFALCFGRGLHWSCHARGAEARFFLWLYAGAFAIPASLALGGSIGNMRDRWLLPALFSLPLALFLLWPDLPKRPVLHRLLPLCATFALATLLLFPARLYLGPRFLGAGPAHQPYPNLAMALEQRFPGIGMIVADDTLLAGNLRFARPGLQVMTTRDVSSDAKRRRQLSSASLLCITQDAQPRWEADCRSVCERSMLISRERIDLPLRLGANGSAAFDVRQMRCTNDLER